MAAPSPADEWLRLLQDVEVARNYPAVYALDTGPHLRQPFLDELLASLLFIRLAALVDSALQALIAQGGLTSPKTRRKKWLDLNDRIQILEHHGCLPPDHVKRLHQIRTWRNKLAHTAEPQYANWALLDQAVSIAEAALQHLTVVGARPKYEFFAEGSKAEASSDPAILYSQDYKAGVKLNGKEELTFHWSRSVLNKA